MKKGLLVCHMAALTLYLMVASCGNITNPIKTGKSTQITDNSVILWGSVQHLDPASDMEIGVFVSTSENPSVENGRMLVGVEIDKNNSYFVEVTGLSPGTKYYYKAFLCVGGIYRVGDVKSFTTEAFKYTAIDLGLPSGLKWATCNVGATTPEEYGDYFAWGETLIKSEYTWSTYKWAKSAYETLDTLTKYCTDSEYGTMDNMTVLAPGDDVAHVKLGNKWRMPTDAEWMELLTKCTWTWTTQGGTYGYKVTSKFNNKSIFLPAAGLRYYNSLNYTGTYGLYWSSTLDSGYPVSAWRIYFDSGNIDRLGDARYQGLSVRPVTE